MRRSSPQTFSTSSASWMPSTRMRLARAMRAGAPGTATEPEAVRAGAAAPEPGAGFGSHQRGLLPADVEGAVAQADLVVAAVVVADRDERLVAGHDDALDRRAADGDVEARVGGQRPAAAS